MLLLDHFRPPLNTRRHWHSFHNAWATYIAADLNQLLPEGYFAEPNVQFGIEIDVATFNETTQTVIPLSVGNRQDWHNTTYARTWNMLGTTNQHDQCWLGRGAPVHASAAEIINNSS